MPLLISFVLLTIMMVLNKHTEHSCHLQMLCKQKYCFQMAHRTLDNAQILVKNFKLNTSAWNALIQYMLTPDAPYTVDMTI